MVGKRRPDAEFEALFLFASEKFMYLNEAIEIILASREGHPKTEKRFEAYRQLNDTLKELLKDIPEAQKVLRKLGERLPAIDVRNAAAQFDSFDDKRQNALVAAVTHGLMHWFIVRGCDAEYPGVEGLFEQGEECFQALLSLNSLLGDKSPEEMIATLKPGLDAKMEELFAGIPVNEVEPTSVGFNAGEAALFDVDVGYKSEVRLNLIEFRDRLRSGALAADLKLIASDLLTSDDPERFTQFAKAFVRRTVRVVGADVGQATPRRIVQTRLTNDDLRRALRVVQMVHELHKAGYQRLRISPGIAPHGGSWRCPITYSDNICADGWQIIDYDFDKGEKVALYTSMGGSAYFDWPDGPKMNARQMAERFLTAFPVIANEGRGRDWAYAGWLCEIISRCENDDFIAFYADWPLDQKELAPWLPPPPLRS